LFVETKSVRTLGLKSTFMRKNLCSPSGTTKSWMGSVHWKAGSLEDRRDEVPLTPDADFDFLIASSRSKCNDRIA
jgi:hypothetical protein